MSPDNTVAKLRVNENLAPLLDDRDAVAGCAARTTSTHLAATTAAHARADALADRLMYGAYAVDLGEGD